VDVKHLVGTVPRDRWPASPEIGTADLQAYEKAHGGFAPGDVVILRSDWTDRYYHPLPTGEAFMVAPLKGTAEGWPAPGPEAVAYLAGKGVRCVTTDAPTLGGVDPRRALWTYWALGTRGMAGVEMLTNLGGLPADAYFLFAAGKIAGCHGGPGRAVALY
jgi:kynurenine formamidase